MELIDASGIDEDGDGSLSKDEFLAFLRGLFLSDIPSTEVEALRQAYHETVALGPIDDARLESLFKDLGFDMNSSNLGDVIGVIDADCDGKVDFNEFMTGIGMMKKMTLLSKQLEAAFRKYIDFAIMKRGYTRSQSQSAPRRRSFLSSSLRVTIHKMSSGRRNVPQTQEEVFDEGCVELAACDLMAFLKVERDDAEEMVFLADQDEVKMNKKDSNYVDSLAPGVGEVKCHRSIDRVEFENLIRTWS